MRILVLDDTTIDRQQDVCDALDFFVDARNLNRKDVLVILSSNRPIHNALKKHCSASGYLLLNIPLLDIWQNNMLLLDYLTAENDCIILKVTDSIYREEVDELAKLIIQRELSITEFKLK